MTKAICTLGLALILAPLGGVRAADKAGAPATAEWVTLFADQGWYKGQKGDEQIFRGKLEGLQPPGIGTLMRNAHYKLGDRTIYTGAKKIAALDAFVGQDVEIRGKPVDMSLEGQNLKELWPAAVRPRSDAIKALP